MELIQWATSPWGKSVPIHIAWGLIWVAVIAGLFFMIVHSLYLIVVAPPKRFAERKAEAAAAAVPERVPRHSLAARLVSLDHGSVDVYAVIYSVSFPGLESSSTGWFITGSRGWC